MTVSISGTTGYAGPLGAITVDTGSIVANAVTPAKMSRTGTSGQVLTSNGTGADPSYQALPSGGVTSAVAGNGVAVSAATGAVTFSAAAPTSNSVGSYASVTAKCTAANQMTFGSTYSAGTGTNQVAIVTIASGTCCCATTLSRFTILNSLSGTWRWMGNGNSAFANAYIFGIAVRVA